MALTPQQQERRRGKVTASFIPKLMAGDEEAIGREWMRLVEHPAWRELDLSDSWGPSFGSFIEPFCLDWHERATGKPLTDRGVFVQHPELQHVGATIDAYRCADNTVIDNKFWGRWSSLDNCLETYPGQLVVQAACTRAERSALLVCHGGDEPAEHQVSWDEDYEAEVWRRVEWFWSCVETLQAPCKLPGVKPPVVNAVRVISMEGNNAWAVFASQWLQTQAAAKTFADAAKNLKALIEPDVARATGHGICASRSKAGSISIKQGSK